MFSNPLGWFETSNLPEDYVTSVSKLATVWKREREWLFSGTIIPVGAAPDGTSWTGFSSVAKDRKSGYALIFRELNDRSENTIDLPLFGKGKHKLTVLAGEGSAEMTDGKLTATIPQALRYLWVRIDP